jgi:hypothetical protein
MIVSRDSQSRYPSPHTPRTLQKPCGRGQPSGWLSEERGPMRTGRHPIRYLVSLIGTGFVLFSLFGCLSLPAVSIAGT